MFAGLFSRFSLSSTSTVSSFLCVVIYMCKCIYLYTHVCAPALYRRGQNRHSTHNGWMELEITTLNCIYLYIVGLFVSEWQIEHFKCCVCYGISSTYRYGICAQCTSTQFSTPSTHLQCLLMCTFVLRFHTWTVWFLVCRRRNALVTLPCLSPSLSLTLCV